MSDKIWVIGWDYGCEGKTSPEMAFLTEEEAIAARELIMKNPSAMQCYLAEVPIWKPKDLSEDNQPL